jgi:very-short-patch-repair endonuclease
MASTEKKESKIANGTNGKVLPRYIKKYGPELGPKRYAEYLVSIFKGIGISKEATSFFDKLISQYQWLTACTLYYRNNKADRSEWFIADDTGICFYDFFVKEASAILEYDGCKWHPSEEDVRERGEELMEVTGVSFEEKFKRDLSKIKKAESRGYRVFIVRSDMSNSQMSAIVDQFIEYVKSKI